MELDPLVEERSAAGWGGYLKDVGMGGGGADFGGGYVMVESTVRALLATDGS